MMQPRLFELEFEEISSSCFNWFDYANDVPMR